MFSVLYVALMMTSTSLVKMSATFFILFVESWFIKNLSHHALLCLSCVDEDPNNEDPSNGKTPTTQPSWTTFFRRSFSYYINNILILIFCHNNLCLMIVYMIVCEYFPLLLSNLQKGNTVDTSSIRSVASTAVPAGKEGSYSLI